MCISSKLTLEINLYSSVFCLSVKPDPPHIKNLSFQNGDLYVQWTNPQNFQSKCLSYEVEVNNSHAETHDIFYVSFFFR